MAIAKPKVFWPLTIDATNNKVYFKQGVTDYTGTIASATYLSANDLFTAVVAAMNAAGAAGTFTFVVTDGKATITNSTTAFIFRWGAFGTNSAYQNIGWAAVDTASALAQTANWQHRNGWYSPVGIRSDGQDRFDQPNSVVTFAVGGQGKSVDEDEQTSRTIKFEFIPVERVFVAFEVSANENWRAWERWWREGRAKFRFWPDGSVEGTNGDYCFDGSTVADGMSEKNISRQNDGKAIYAIGPLLMRKYVP